ncbi:MAG: Uma2 family endonuclease [Coleofasciculus sp. G3-WIS-01]|uniref:Uma2 family endonuclease n=1 Tax=Coleofasciculus sp. G3-WIS-01 TaxID=3069528 RepID=UPI0032F944B7
MITTEQVRWTVGDLELFPEDGKRYEIIDGELIVTRAPHWKHQEVTGNVYAQLQTWSRQTGLGRAAIAPGIIFSATDSVIPDVVWASNQRLEECLDESGHLTDAPELVVEVLSKGNKDRQRDLELKLKLYSTQGVQEYWILDRQKQEIKVYRREQAMLKLVVTLFAQDVLTTSILPGFSGIVGELFN